MSSDPSTPSHKGQGREESTNPTDSNQSSTHPQDASHDQDSSASLSTTPTQSLLGGRISGSGSGNSWNSRAEDSSADGSQSGTIGRGPPPRTSVSSGNPRSSAPRSAAAVSREGSQPQSQRAVSYAPSDLETVSGMSTSEYSSGEEDVPASATSATFAAPASSQSGSRGRGNSTARSTAARSVASKPPPSSNLTASNAGSGSGGRRSSTAGTARSSSRNRRPSLARTGLNDDDEDDRYGPLDDEDDEVEPHDRGEELVRRRMKARQIEKAKRKKKEKEQQKAAAAADAGRRASVATPTSPRARSGSVATARAMSPTGGDHQGLDREGKPNFISLPPPSISDSAALSPGLTSAGTQPQPSPSAGRSSLPSTPFYPSPHSHIRRPQQQSVTSSGSTTAGGAGPARRISGMSGTAGGQGQSVSGRSSAGTVQASQNQQQSQTGDVFSESGAPSTTAGSVLEDGGEEEEIDPDEERDVVGGLATEQPPLEDAGVDQEEEEEEGDDSGSPSGDGSEEDVEYTLKDRQDAINIEHPFGLPIWKPALYKKSRSVTRNAESALHQLPTAAAERHLLPGNLLWTLLAGSWLAAVCFFVGIILNFVPFGGSRYARVAWELGGYIFWPFGKYVEVEVDPLSGERGMSYATQDGDGEGEEEDGYESYQGNDDQVEVTSFTPVAARFPHDHTHKVPFNSRATKREGSQDDDANANQGESTSSGSNSQGESSTAKASDSTERSSLKGKGKETISSYGAINDNEDNSGSGNKDRVSEEEGVYEYVLDQDGNDIGHAGRLVGKLAYGFFFWLVIAPLMGIVCLACWGAVFPIPMAKLTWVLLKNLSTRPLALHFRSALSLAEHEQVEVPDSEGAGGKAKKFFKPLRPGQLAPRSKSFKLGESGGNSSGSNYRRSKILLCTYRAVGSQYYKYTVGGVNILFVNTLPIVGFTILDFFFLERYVEHHEIKTGFLAFIAAQGTIFILALLSVIPLSYFIGMAVASISAQSSIGMGAVINATFGSIIEIILYAIALTQQKARLVEGSLVGSILAGVLLMPGLSMCSGATRRKEQRFNARSAGVTSTMLIMAIIGILTPTLFYQIYGTFQLTCEGCPDDGTPGQSWTCKRCFYEHVPPATDPFYQDNVKGLMYTCTVILVLSYGIGLWFSLRTHASQIWQNPNPQPSHQPSSGNGTVAGNTLLSTAHGVTSIPSAQRASIYKRLVPQNVIQQLLPTHNRPNSQASQTGSHQATSSSVQSGHVKGKANASSTSENPENAPALQLPESYSQEDYARAVAITASAFHSAMQQQNQHQQQQGTAHSQPQQHQVSANQAMPRGGGGEAAPRHVSMHEGEDEGGHGGHDAPSWSRGTSVSVLLGCTVLYAIIAEILVDVVDVVLDGSGIDEKFLGITLFALVPNTTEFMNAMSFAINGNIALSMEIGSAYALQVCLIQIPAMVGFSAYYNATHDLLGSPIHRSFTLIFPRWDVIAIIFSVFLLTYTYIEARSNYYRGSICILSYLVLVAGFFFAPSTGDTELPEDGAGPNVVSSFTSFPAYGGSLGGSPLAPNGSEQNFSSFGGLINHPALAPTVYGLQWVGAVVGSLWTR